MEYFHGIDTPALLVAAMMVGLVAGVIKGMVGFALPTVLVSGLGAMMSAEVALAGMILPTLIANGWQALRQGPKAAWRSIWRFRVFLAVSLVVLLICAQLVPILPERALVLIIGGSVTFFAVLQLLGLRLRLPAGSQRKSEVAFGAIAGMFGGLSGIWGPPTVAMLTALDTEKTEQMRVQGVVYGLGALALAVAHLGSGVLRAETLPLSLALVPVSLLGVALGFRIQDRIDQRTFRRATLAVLLIAGLNLVRRGLM